MILVIWLGLLFTTIGIAASDFFCINLSTIATILGMSESLAGVTFLAFGNGSPDVFSTFAAMGSHSGSLAVGELIGAAGFITAVVAGSMALVRPFKVARKSFVRDVGFFIVATAFSLVFLADGNLHLWECVVMIVFYIFYVITVVIWHWWLGRRRRQRLRLAAAREPFHSVGAEELEREEEYHDDDEDGAAGDRDPASGRSADDFGALERNASSPGLLEMNEDDEDEAQERFLSDISSNMRVRRRPQGRRQSTVTPIRPSLVGALEFRAVLSSLQKARNLQTIPINLRRYSDDPYPSADQRSHNSESDIRTSFEEERNSLGHNTSQPDTAEDLLDLEGSGHRQRAVSANDAVRLKLDTASLIQQNMPPEIGLSAATPTAKETGQSLSFDVESSSQTAGPVGSPSPTLSLTPPGSLSSPQPLTSKPPQRAAPSSFLAPPSNGSYFPSQDRPVLRLSVESLDSPDDFRKIDSKQKSSRTLSPLTQTGSTASSPAVPFPLYIESPATLSGRGGSHPPSIRLPPPSISPVSYQTHDGDHDRQPKPLKWWPYSVLPSPHVLAATLFPTLYTLPDKNIWEKFLGIVAAPAVFLLTITLPVVECDKDDDDSEIDAVQEGVFTPATNHARPRQGTFHTLIPESPLMERLADHQNSEHFANSAMRSQGHSPIPPSPSGFTGHGNIASLAISAEQHYNHLERQNNKPLDGDPVHRDSFKLPRESSEPIPSVSKDWCRWLVCMQIVLAPFFVVLVIWAGSTPDPMNPRSFLRPALIAILVSLILLAALLVTTSPTEPPKWRLALCFLGFIVSVAWISTIANEVVGVLKAFGVILGISDAILGLTVFAIGNSLGDLVADITVAKLGYPVMALSACFGGPMLNILLGIGISGLYMTLKQAAHRHEKHPNKAVEYKPFEIEVSSTIMVSGVTLLVTLLGLLVIVPLNGWKMDRRIGWGLIALWTVSSAGNLVVEVTGWAGKVS
jgi:sodium/potassium/calcium exchanger 6